MTKKILAASVTATMTITDTEANLNRIACIAEELAIALNERDRSDPLPALLHAATAMDAIKACLTLARASLDYDVKCNRADSALDKWAMVRP